MTTSDARLRITVEQDRQRITAGERPVYHATWAPTLDGAADITIAELPIIHVFVPDDSRIPDGARLLIARTLSVDPDAFDVVVDEPGRANLDPAPNSDCPLRANLWTRHPRRARLSRRGG